jgi:hypothetical protein
MTADDFRRIALGMKGAVEGAHMDHPDFRVNGRIFGSIRGDQQWGMVKLSPEEQERFVRAAPNVFKPESGAWGLQGCTAVRLHDADEETVGEALTLAFKAAASKPARIPGARKRPPSRPRAKP